MIQLHNIHIAGQPGLKQLTVTGNDITAIGEASLGASPQAISFSDAVAFPGLINSHDHLDFNLFPLLGKGGYKDYKEWAADIHLHDNEKIKAIQKIPKALRVSWGMYKNLLNGVTTVVEHGEKITVTGNKITVIQDVESLHSIAFEKRWKWKLNNVFSKRKKICIHIGEGTDAAAEKEISTYIRNNFTGRKSIAVHGVAMKPSQAGHFEALVWCPSTNFNLLGQTADIQSLKKNTTVLFGTDATLTASWNIWEQLRQALQTGMVTEEELLDMLTINAARIWSLRCGALQTGMQADIVIAKKKRLSIFDTNPEDILLVMQNGNIRLFDASLATQVLPHTDKTETFSTIRIGDSVKYVQGDIPRLMEKISTYCPSVIFPIQAGS